MRRFSVTDILTGEETHLNIDAIVWYREKAVGLDVSELRILLASDVDGLPSTFTVTSSDADRLHRVTDRHIADT